MSDHRSDQPETPSEESPPESADGGPAAVPSGHDHEKSPDSVRDEGGEAAQSDGIPPKAGYPKLDPRHEDKPYEPGRHDGVPDAEDEDAS